MLLDVLLIDFFVVDGTECAQGVFVNNMFSKSAIWVVVALLLFMLFKQFDNHSVAAGAKPIMPVADMFWGDRYGQVEDPFGHRWSLATHVRDVKPEDLQQAMEKAFAQN